MRCSFECLTSRMWASDSPYLPRAWGALDQLAGRPHRLGGNQRSSRRQLSVTRRTSSSALFGAPPPLAGSPSSASSSRLEVRPAAARRRLWMRPESATLLSCLCRCCCCQKRRRQPGRIWPLGSPADCSLGGAGERMLCSERDRLANEGRCRSGSRSGPVQATNGLSGFEEGPWTRGVSSTGWLLGPATTDSSSGTHLAAAWRLEPRATS